MRVVLIVLWVQLSAAVAANAAVVRDGEVVLTETQLQYALTKTPANLVTDMQKDEAARYQFISLLIAAERYHLEAERLASEDPKIALALRRTLQATYREFIQTEFQKSLVIPDLEELARESYKADYQALGPVPELRRVSHILLSCEAERCQSDDVLDRLKELQNKLAAGEEFGSLARRWSDDLASARIGGAISRPFDANTDALVAPFRDAAFALTTIDEVSGPVKSEFGWHLIRLDQIVPARIRTFEEVKNEMMAIHERRYRQEKLKAYIESFGPSEDLQIDAAAFEALLNGARGSK